MLAVSSVEKGKGSRGRRWSQVGPVSSAVTLRMPCCAVATRWSSWTMSPPAEPRTCRIEPCMYAVPSPTRMMWRPPLRMALTWSSIWPGKPQLSAHLRSRRLIFVTNVTGTLNIIAACIRHRVPRILYASSMTVYGHPEALPINEEHPARPISYYGVTKYAAERYLMATALRTDLDFALHATAFRMFNVYGSRQRLDNPYQGVMGIFIGNVLRDEPIAVFGDGEQTRDFIHVQDVTAAWLSAVDNPAAFNQVFNLGTGQRISINRLIDAVLVAGGTATH